MKMTLIQAVNRSSVLPRPFFASFQMIPAISRCVPCRDDGEDEPVDNTIIVD